MSKKNAEVHVNSKASYFVADDDQEYTHQRVQLTSNRLINNGWELVVSKSSVHLKYSKGGDLMHLSKSTLEGPGAGNTVYRANGEDVSLRGWLDMGGKTGCGYTLDEKTTWQEHQFRRGPTEGISILVSSGGIYVVADASAETHSMLSGYYDLAKEHDHSDWAE